jgi:hypothetical protein
MRCRVGEGPQLVSHKTTIQRPGVLYIVEARFLLQPRIGHRGHRRRRRAGRDRAAQARRRRNNAPPRRDRWPPARGPRRRLRRARAGRDGGGGSLARDRGRAGVGTPAGGGGRRRGAPAVALLRPGRQPRGPRRVPRRLGGGAAAGRERVRRARDDRRGRHRARGGVGRARRRGGRRRAGCCGRRRHPVLAQTGAGRGPRGRGWVKGRRCAGLACEAGGPACARAAILGRRTPGARAPPNPPSAPLLMPRPPHSPQVSKHASDDSCWIVVDGEVGGVAWAGTNDWGKGLRALMAAHRITCLISTLHLANKHT